MAHVAYCHNALCDTQRDLDAGTILLHQERSTGAWVPDWCPVCREDLHKEPLESDEDEE